MMNNLHHEFILSKSITRKRQHSRINTINCFIVERRSAAKASLGGNLPETLSYVEEELEKLLEEVKKVGMWKAIGEIDGETAEIQLDSLINAARAVEITGEGIVKVEGMR